MNIHDVSIVLALSYNWQRSDDVNSKLRLLESQQITIIIRWTGQSSNLLYIVVIFI